MKTFKPLLLVATLLLLAGCNASDDELTQEQQLEELRVLAEELNEISTSVPCTNPDDWTFTAVGSKACGGPTGYLPYSIQIDVAAFLEKVENYRLAQQAYNERWEIVSDCSIPARPRGVICEDGEAVLVFS